MNTQSFNELLRSGGPLVSVFLAVFALFTAMFVILPRLLGLVLIRAKALPNDLLQALDFKLDVQGWNQWRTENRSQRVRLAQIDLSDAVLPKLDLSLSIIFDSRFTGADLRGANFSRTVLNRVNLSGADLTGADLSNAELIDCAIESATISESQLHSVRRILKNGFPVSASDLVGKAGSDYPKQTARTVAKWLVDQQHDEGGLRLRKLSAHEAEKVLLLAFSVDGYRDGRLQHPKSNLGYMLLLYPEKNPGERILLMWRNHPDGSQVGERSVRSAISIMEAMQLQRTFVVTSNGVTKSARRLVDKMRTVEFFHEDDILHRLSKVLSNSELSAAT